MPKLRSPTSYGINSRNDTSDPPRHPHLRRHDREAGTHQAADRRGHHARKGVTRCKLKKVRCRPNPSEFVGGDEGDRTLDLRIANAMVSSLAPSILPPVRI